MKKFQDHHQYIVKLSGGIEDIKAILPSNTTQSGESAKIVNELKQTLSLLDRLIADRNIQRNELTNISQNVEKCYFIVRLIIFRMILRIDCWDPVENLMMTFLLKN